MDKKIPLQLLQLHNDDIFDQLSIEQCLLSLSPANYIIIHTAPKPSVVMGISGKKQELINEDKLLEDKVPLIKRYSGGGCVYLDHNCIMLSYIFNKVDANNINYPAEIMQWSFSFLKNAFKHTNAALRENDYTFKSKKFGGNAQYIKKERFTHHSSLLFSCDFEKMERYLKLPKKRPNYRESRSHTHFLEGIEEHYPSMEEFINIFNHELQKSYQVQQIDKESIKLYLNQEFRNSNIRVC
ncbi:MAG: lipoate--protein ligase family protein [Chlamydiales bacterium]|nr:lipoate--protein ligase family protein [Chlamydiales bacterium]NCF70703.1 lipoate--protein ligase family protein [Chlamydiales bacterium]